MDEPDPQTAFIAAFLALMVLPLVVAIGLSAIGLAAGLLTSTDSLAHGNTGWVLIGLFIVWVVLAVIGVLVVISRVTRRRTRS